MRSNVLATISTANRNTLQPESALIAFAELESLELIFVTREGSRKYVNLAKNSRVALVIGWDINNWQTLQYEGLASAVKKRDYPQCRQLFATKEDTPCTDEFLLNPAMKFFSIKPTWIGFSDFTAEKPSVIELTDFSEIGTGTFF